VTPHPDPAQTEDDPRVLAAVQEYLAELESGRRPDRRAFADRHPDLGDALPPYLDALDALQVVAPRSSHSRPPAQGEPPPAEPLGDFRIVREIGRGGMGVVYEAVQLSLGRQVALKVLPFAAALNARQLQRFKTEAHAAAQLHHSNIVPVYAVGCERGVHYYAMQLIDGRPLDAVVHELRGEPAGPSGSSPTVDFRAGPTARRTGTTGAASRAGRGREAYRAAARIAAQAADALAYAHDAGVVHRDVKPANLLLDAKGNVWVADFGLAQVAADPGLTRTGDVFGTLRYMSPEQAAGRRLDIDHRADIYSLAATLYELLTLEPVFPDDDREALLHRVLRDDPRPPRQIDRAIPVELETIVLKALAKAPEERYATAAELGDDLRRFLDDRPVLARRPSLFDRGRKWLRRHPAYVGAAVLLLLFGVVGLAVSTALVAREQGHTRQAYDREKKRAEEAEERFQLARRSVDEMIRIGEEELADNPMAEGLRRRLLEASLKYYQEFIELRQDDPTARDELERTRDRIRRIVADLALLQGDRNLVLLDEPAVLDDLRLAADQRARVADVAEQVRERWGKTFREAFRLSPDERSRRFLEQARANDAAVSAVLTPRQLDRLRQIARQTQGPIAFRDPDVAAALQLTAAQRERVRAVEQEMFEGGRRDRGRGGPRKEPDRRAATQRILALLTPDQLARWKELTGEPFAGPWPRFPGPPRPPGHRPPGSRGHAGPPG
jgi:serine/threonine protein kinase